MAYQDYHSIKVPGWVYSNWKQAAVALQRQGVAPLSKDILAPTVCPACQSRMQHFKAEYEYRQCNRCGYTQQDLTASSNFLGGALLGIGLTLLFKPLSESNTAHPTRRRPLHHRPR